MGAAPHSCKEDSSAVWCEQNQAFVCPECESAKCKGKPEHSHVPLSELGYFMSKTVKCKIEAIRKKYDSLKAERDQHALAISDFLRELAARVTNLNCEFEADLQSRKGELERSKATLTDLVNTISTFAKYGLDTAKTVKRAVRCMNDVIQWKENTAEKFRETAVKEQDNEFNAIREFCKVWRNFRGDYGRLANELQNLVSKPRQQQPDSAESDTRKVYPRVHDLTTKIQTVYNSQIENFKKTVDNKLVGLQKALAAAEAKIINIRLPQPSIVISKPTLIENVDNASCYITSVLQCLFASKNFVAAISQLRAGSLTRHLKTIMKNYATGYKMVSPKNMIEVLFQKAKTEEFRHCMSGDAFFSLSAILGILINEYFVEMNKK